MRYRIIYIFQNNGAEQIRWVDGRDANFKVSREAGRATLFKSVTDARNMLHVVAMDVESDCDDTIAYIEQKVSDKWIPQSAYFAANALPHI